MKNKTRLLIEELIDKGYTIIDGDVVSPKGRKLSAIVNKKGYLSFGHRMRCQDTMRMELHRFIGYFKFGDKIFEPGLQIRHLDGNPLNNNESNLAIGTATDNARDKDPEVVRRAALFASSKRPVIHKHKEILKRREQGATIKQIMQEFGISSKGTVSYIINKCLLANGGKPKGTENATTCLVVADEEIG